MFFNILFFSPVGRRFFSSFFLFQRSKLLHVPLKICLTIAATIVVIDKRENGREKKTRSCLFSFFQIFSLHCETIFTRRKKKAHSLK